MSNPGGNYQTLYGALVGGPGTDDSYIDDRNDFIHNEVATDYNAAFQGVLAALHQLKNNGELL
jgi:endoglucanase